MMSFPIHPKFVHFPIAFILGGLLLDLLGRCLKREDVCKAAIMLTMMAALSLTGAVITGLFEAKRLQLSHPILDKHQLMAFLTMAVVWLGLFGYWSLRQYKILAQRILTIALLLASVLVLITAHWGGLMVYQYSVGITP